MGLNTGSGTQQKQTAECIMKKIHNHHMKKRPSFWTGSLYCVHVLCCMCYAACAIMPCATAVCATACATAVLHLLCNLTGLLSSGLPRGVAEDMRRHMLLRSKKHGHGLHLSTEPPVDICMHVLIKEVVAWYAKDRSRMRDFDNLDFKKMVPPLPAWWHGE